MIDNKRFSILCFPQYFDGAQLSLRVLVLPRNQNPLAPAIELNGAIPDAPAFADAKLVFELKVISGLTVFPHSLAAQQVELLPTAPPAQARALFEALAQHFDVGNRNAVNDVLVSEADQALASRPVVRKYLPLSYREAFAFTTPRSPYAVTDDSYHCAIRDARKPVIRRSPDTISWGQVFAYALRQPSLAAELGMVYEITLPFDPAPFAKGGFLYVDLAAGSDFQAQQAADDDFIKKYAARIPALQAGLPRPLFAPILYPVLFKNAPADPDPEPEGSYDQVFIETAAYDDGFAKIVHTQQAPSRNLLVEKNEGAHPVKDIGIRLGWDDEQILSWYLRQLVPQAGKTKPLDAPLGVFGYSIDVRLLAEPENAWESLNWVYNKLPLGLPADPGPEAPILPLGDFNGELPFSVYPVEPQENAGYWLPMYFGAWNGKSMVLPDADAAALYHTNSPDIKPDNPAPNAGTGVTGPAQNRLNEWYAMPPLATVLRYGLTYEFRVRLRDLSGGAPPVGEPRAVHESPAGISRQPFKRYVAPNQLRVAELNANSDLPTSPDQLTIRRPLLGYPAVVFTGKYGDPVGRLQAASQAMMGQEAFGIADPDVDRVEILVEVQTLKMDNLLSASGRESYAVLYRTERFFPAIGGEDDYENALSIPVVYKDCRVLHPGEEAQLVADLQLPGEIDQLEELVLPQARTIRLTVRAVCENKEQNDAYYGSLDEKNSNFDNRFGQIVQLTLHRASIDETGLFINTPATQRLQGIFLRPNEAPVFDGTLKSRLLGKVDYSPSLPDTVQRLALQLKLRQTGLTLMPEKGERVQFGCSARIRHTLSPENSSLTFASQGDLVNHWLCCLDLHLDRDWTWDALEDQSLVVTRTLRFTHDDPDTETEIKEVGDIEIRRTASLESLHDPQRTYTRLIFIDAVEPQNHRTQSPETAEPRFPDTIEVSYRIETRFKPEHAQFQDEPVVLDLTLPITTPPVQIPKIASAGVALSPYIRNEAYSATEPRRRYLWVEFEEPVRDPKDTIFARVLAYAPDQLISNNHPELFITPEPPPLAIDPEPIRVVVNGSSNDLAGLNAMRPLEASSDSARHFILPLPPGLHADAAELFGFFTYEFRIGHFREKETQTMVWCTAQGRYGRPIQARGIQHPAPNLTCMANRDETKLFVTAPYAAAVFDGRDVTADPPRTQLWGLLYAQVRQADNLDNRNILLDDKMLDWKIEIETNPEAPAALQYTDLQLSVLRNSSLQSWKQPTLFNKYQQVLKLADLEKSNKDAIRYGTAVWGNGEVVQLLERFGLPGDQPLSVLVVEILPSINNIFDHISDLDRPEVAEAGSAIAGRSYGRLIEEARMRKFQAGRQFQSIPSPLNERLGHHRILRTSPLTEVPFVCCTDC